MMEWVSSKVATSAVVLMIALSFLGLFTIQADTYRRMELEDLADAVADLVTEVDLLTCEASLVVNWTSSMESHGLPRTFHGEPYVIEFTAERPYVRWGNERVAGHHFTGRIGLQDAEGEAVDLLEVPSTTGFVVTSKATWMPFGLGHPIKVRPLC